MQEQGLSMQYPEASREVIAVAARAINSMSMQDIAFARGGVLEDIHSVVAGETGFSSDVDRIEAIDRLRLEYLQSRTERGSQAENLEDLVLGA